MEHSETTKVIHLTTSMGKPCQDCRKLFSSYEEIDEAINHYIGHGYKLLHVGSQTKLAPDGKQLWHDTVAVLGK
jgi:hypothetical protein